MIEPPEEYDDTVCPECIDDKYLKGYVRDNASELGCSYCDTTSTGDAIAVSVDQLVGVIRRGIESEWEDAAQCVPYESAEGGYQWPTHCTSEVLESIGFHTRHEDLHDRICSALPSHSWVEKDPCDDGLWVGWEEFSDAVKHRTRYLFFEVEAETASYSNGASPHRMLDEIGTRIRELELVKTIYAGTVLVRARVHDPGVTCETLADLGPPHVDAVVSANRMSPAGISMFYAALDEQTAIAETPLPHLGCSAEVTIASFELIRDLRVVDLVTLPSIPSLFDPDVDGYWRRGIAFLHAFVNNLIVPVVKDGREHVEYVPSQVVTEYLRYRFTDFEGSRILGMLYPSAQKPDGVSCVLFISREDCVGGGGISPLVAPPIQLLAGQIRTVSLSPESSSSA